MLPLPIARALWRVLGGRRTTPVARGGVNSKEGVSMRALGIRGVRTRQPRCRGGLGLSEQMINLRFVLRQNIVGCVNGMQDR